MLRIRPVYVQLLFLLFSTLLVLGQNQSSGINRIYNTDQLRADLRFLRKKLEKIHLALYRYTAKPSFDVFFDSVYNSIGKPMV